jgi:hypothetical protein
MANLFYAYRALDSRNAADFEPPCYFIESTAPDNVDDRLPEPIQATGALRRIDDPDEAVRQIAERLANAEAPNLVVMVHGFNNPEAAALRFYNAAAEAIMGAPLASSRRALPLFPVWLLRIGGLAVLSLLAGYALWSWLAHGRGWFGSLLWHGTLILALAVVGLVAVGMLLRGIVYFRDGYRAVSYGVPDLVEIIRQIDASIRIRSPGNARKRVELSFIGHSMGAFVVTDAIRVLTNLFADDSLRATLNTGTITTDDDAIKKISPDIGHVFTLKRFVLASPDIPAETLLSNRANFLEPSLRRFEEAYLFSNEGDEVLRQVSTTANYFSFPTSSSSYGYRLGNVEILASAYGVVEPRKGDFVHSLRIGRNTLHKLYKKLRDAGLSPGQKLVVEKGKSSYQERLAKVFTYFDCTDYIDNQPKKGLLTFALRKKESDPTARLSFWNHARLLYAYVFKHQQPNVHGGYFQGELCRQLIFRFACLGYAETLNSFGGLADLSKACAEKQIKVLLTPPTPPAAGLKRTPFGAPA